MRRVGFGTALKAATFLIGSSHEDPDTVEHAVVGNARFSAG